MIDKLDQKLALEKKEEIKKQIISIMAQNNITSNQSRDLLLETSRDILNAAHSLKVTYPAEN